MFNYSILNDLKYLQTIFTTVRCLRRIYFELCSSYMLFFQL